MRSSANAPISMSITLGAISCCRNNTRRAEQRWPALLKAERITSFTTCSASAELSTIIAFWQPVSAISGTMAPSRAARARCSWVAVAVEPVKTTPLTRAARFDQQRRLSEQVGAGDGAAAVPFTGGGCGGGQRMLDGGRVRQRDGAEQAAAIGRIVNRP